MLCWGHCFQINFLRYWQRVLLRDSPLPPGRTSNFLAWAPGPCTRSPYASVLHSPSCALTRLNPGTCLGLSSLGLSGFRSPPSAIAPRTQAPKGRHFPSPPQSSLELERGPRRNSECGARKPGCMSPHLSEPQLPLVNGEHLAHVFLLQEGSVDQEPVHATGWVVRCSAWQRDYGGCTGWWLCFPRTM